MTREPYTITPVTGGYAVLHDGRAVGGPPLTRELAAKVAADLNTEARLEAEAEAAREGT